MRCMKQGSVLLLMVLAGACAQQEVPPAPQVAAAGNEAQRDPAATGAVPGSTAGEAIDAAIAALGGAERLNAIRNITMVGYGHHAYQQGGGNISPLPNAPQKYIAANDLRRIYDLENKRYYQQERRNDLFPFAAYRGHDFALARQILDGSVAYALNPQNEANRLRDPRELRMWMYTNPVVALRAAKAPASKVENRREEIGLTLVDVTVPEGDQLTIAIRPPFNEPAFVRWIAPSVNIGEVVLTTYFSGYIPFDGVLLPLGYNTKEDWRDVELLKLWIDGYYLDTEIQDLAAPAQLADAPTPVPAVVRELRPGVWRIGGTAVIEFADHLTLFEAGGGPDRVREMVALANTIIPGKKATRLVQSHHHFDHTAGLRQAVAEGLQIISRRNNCIIYEEMTSRKAPHFPDDLERNGNKLDCVPVDDSLVLEDGTARLELYHTINNNHTADNVFGYMPAHKMIIEADVASAAADLQWWGDSWIDNVKYRNLDVELNLPIHDNGGKGIWTYQQTLDFVQPGIDNVKKWCAEHEKAGNWFTGCPGFLR